MFAGALALPIVLAMAVGAGFAKPAFWSDDLAIPAFIAVRPLTDDDIVAVKVRVAAVSAAASWLLVLAFAVIWLPLWGNLDAIGRIVIALQAFHGDSIAAVGAIGALALAVAMLLTWRFLVSRMWTGLSGERRLYLASATSLGLAAIAAIVFDATKLPGWVLREPAHVTALVWAAAVAVAAKYAVAVRAWRDVDPRYVRQYRVLWLGGTAACAALALVLWNIARSSGALDVHRMQMLQILVSLLVVPVARVGVARACLARNRHRAT